MRLQKQQGRPEVTKIQLVREATCHGIRICALNEIANIIIAIILITSQHSQ